MPRLPGMALWAWDRPESLPSGFMVSIPAEVLAAYPAGLPFTLADILAAAAIAPNQFQAVSLFGTEWQQVSVYGAYLNCPVPLPTLDGCREISILLSDGMSVVAAPGESVGDAVMEPALASGASAPKPGRMFERIESAWRASVQIERQLAGARQKLSAMLASLGKLDRDLGPDERVAADREDRDAWRDARRWMRDLAAKCHRELKSYDIGTTSAAGHRNWIEQVFKEVIEPRVPNNDMDRYHREFETYRRDMVNLQKSMNAALQGAQQNGTQRAQRILATISAKVRQRRARNREPLGGMNMDSSCRRKR
ncbi:MAG TPA: hypothetical protein EYG03_25815 [Planctomycetes bacterium]|nr:hypothetical protein [Fuerstiella sp.]HIK95377.1 hypothetical protein [Planctomycetota bacterium]